MTPMQEHIEWLKNERSKLYKKAKEKFSVDILGFVYKLDDCIKQAESMLEEEKEVIMEAHCHNRCIDNETYECTMEAFKNAEEYYNETFNTK